MAGVDVHGIEGMKEIVGEEIGPGEARAVTQELIDGFAEVSGDHQWIHVDPERSAKESPYGKTIAHGNLTLSLADSFRKELVRADGFALGVNYGWNKIRFPAPVPSGSEVRLGATLASLEDVSGGVQALLDLDISVRDADTPSCVAQAVIRYYR